MAQYCSVCGSKLDTGDAFCSYCGTQVIPPKRVAPSTAPQLQFETLPPRGTKQIEYVREERPSPPRTPRDVSYSRSEYSSGSGVASIFLVFLSLGVFGVIALFGSMILFGFPFPIGVVFDVIFSLPFPLWLSIIIIPAVIIPILAAGKEERERKNRERRRINRR